MDNESTNLSVPDPVVISLNKQVADLNATLISLRRAVKAAKKQQEYWVRRSLRSEDERTGARRQISIALNERNRLVALLAAVFPGSHLVEANIMHYPEETRARPRILRKTVCLHFPDSQFNATFHINPDEEHLFEGLPLLPDDWDGHTTDEKYDVIHSIVTATMAARSEVPTPS